MRPPGRPDLPALTGLRFFLAFFVLTFHQTYPGEMLGPEVLGSHPLLQGFLRSGYVSVGFFFLLSGFVLAYGYDLSDTWTFQGRKLFWQARFARIYPVYLLALLMTIPFAVLHLRQMEPKPSRPTSLFLSVLTLPLLQSWIPASADVWNGPAWSLSDEAFFYLLFPFIGRFLWRLGRREALLSLTAALWLTAILITFAVTSIMSPSLAQTHAHDLPMPTPWNAFIKYNPIMHLAEFVAGITLARLYLEVRETPEGPLRSGRGMWLCGPALAAEIFILTFGDQLSYAMLHNGLLLPLHAAIIIGLALGGPGLPRWLSFRGSVLLGQSSYALYLLHVALWSWMMMFSRHVLHRRVVGLSSFLAYSVFTIATSCLIYVCLEEPARRYVLRHFNSYRPIAEEAPGTDGHRTAISEPAS